MAAIAIPRPGIQADLTRRMVLVGLLSALAVDVCLVLAQYDVAWECRGGAFSSGFSHGFDVRRCDVVIRRFGRKFGRVQLPQS